MKLNNYRIIFKLILSHLAAPLEDHWGPLVGCDPPVGNPWSMTGSSGFLWWMDRYDLFVSTQYKTVTTDCIVLLTWCSNTFVDKFAELLSDNISRTLRSIWLVSKFSNNCYDGFCSTHLNDRSTCVVQSIQTVAVLEVFTEDPRPEDPGPDPGPVWVRVYILNGQPGPGRVPIYYFGSRVCLTLCVIPKLIGEHRTRQWSVSVSMRVFCSMRFVKWGWEKCEREIRWGGGARYLSRQKQSSGGLNVSTASGRWSWIPSWVMWKKKSWNKTEETHLLLNTHTVKL